MSKTRALELEDKIDVIHRLLYLWKANPSLRLTQLIGNVYHVPSGVDNYNVEDFPFIEELEKHYGTAKDKPTTASSPST